MIKEIEVVVKDGKFMFNCPVVGCTTSKLLDAPKETTNKKKIYINIKCKCGNVSKVLLNIRECYRKRVDIAANLYINGYSTLYSPVVIDNISMGGLGCHYRKILSRLRFVVGDVIDITYAVDIDGHDRTITDKIEITWITETDDNVYFGGRCINNVEYTQPYKDKGFFLRKIL